MSIRMHLGYWTIFNNGKPVISCISFARAYDMVAA